LAIAQYLHLSGADLLTEFSPGMPFKLSPSIPVDKVYDRCPDVSAGKGSYDDGGYYL
jgi:hypothetical protein